jgi:hypothetical protein
MKLVEKRLMIMIHSYLNMLTNYFESKGSEDPETDAFFFGALLDGIGFQFMISPEHFPLEKIKAKLLQMYS